MADVGDSALLVLGAGALTIGGEISRGQSPRPSVFIGTAGAGLLVLMLGQANPELAHGLALVLFLTSLLTSGYSLAQGVARALRSTGGPST